MCVWDVLNSWMTCTICFWVSWLGKRLNKQIYTGDGVETEQGVGGTGGTHWHVQTLSYFVRQQVGALSKYGSGVTVGTKLTLIWESEVSQLMTWHRSQIHSINISFDPHSSSNSNIVLKCHLTRHVTWHTNQVCRKYRKKIRRKLAFELCHATTSLQSRFIFHSN